MSIKIFYKDEDGQDEGKAKGAWVEEEENEGAPEFVGLSKKQFFGFLIAAILMGAGIFGIGYTLAYFKKEHVIDKKKSAISLNKDAIAASEENGMSMIPGSSYVNYPGKSSGEGGEGGDSPTPPEDTKQAIATSNANAHVTENTYEIYNEKKYYVSLGMCKTEEEAKKLIDIVKGLGKTGNMKNHELGFIVYLGPFGSRSQAQTEVDAIELSTSLTASIVRTIQ